jgi:hypothetical protein
MLISWHFMFQESVIYGGTILGVILKCSEDNQAREGQLVPFISSLSQIFKPLNQETRMELHLQL